MFNKILIAIDAGPPAAQALQAAAELAGQIDAEVAVLHVVDITVPFQPELETTSAAEIARLRRAGTDLMGGVTINARRFLVEGDPADAIITTAQEWGADLIVLGSDSRGRLAHFLLGSTADSVIRRSPCPVMTVRVRSDQKQTAAISSGSRTL